MAKKRRYVCSACGQMENGWTGKCPACGQWGTMEEMLVEPTAHRPSEGPRPAGRPARILSQIQLEDQSRLDTGMEELNRVLGGGLVPDSLTMLTARPGAGKSTLLLQLCAELSKRGARALYASGEESLSQIRARADRLFDHLPEQVYLMAGNSMDQVEGEVSRLHPNLLVIDSVQTFIKEAYPQRQGTPTQTLAVTDAAVGLCKSGPAPLATFLVGHMTKADEMAGLRTLEHLVDTVLYLEDGVDDRLRLLRSSKNRFGYTGELGLFQMDERGLSEVRDPYALFLTKREAPVAGAAISLQREGSRLIPIEIEALVSTSSEPYPARIGDSIKRDRLNTLIAILEQKAGFHLTNQAVVLKATGGLAIKERVLDLPILMAIASSAQNRPLSPSEAFLAEVGLTGELKRVDNLSQRLSELKRLGFRRVYVPAFTEKRTEQDFQVLPCKDLQTVLDLALKAH